MAQYALYVGKSRELTGSLVVVIEKTDSKTTFKFNGQLYRCLNEEIKIIGGGYITRSRQTINKVVMDFVSPYNSAGYNDQTKLSRAA